MRKISGTIIILLWAVLFAGLAFQFYRMTAVNQMNNRIIRLYQVKSSLPKEFTTAEDSLRKEITKLLEKREYYLSSVPSKSIFSRTVILQIYLLMVSILTFLWLFYNRRKQE